MQRRRAQQMREHYMYYKACSSYNLFAGTTLGIFLIFNRSKWSEFENNIYALWIYINLFMFFMNFIITWRVARDYEANDEDFKLQVYHDLIKWALSGYGLFLGQKDSFIQFSQRDGNSMCFFIIFNLLMIMRLLDLAFYLL